MQSRHYFLFPFKVLAFPCNQFGGQEPGTDEEIQAFAAKKGFMGTLFKKIEVNGDNSHEIFKWLKAIGLIFLLRIY